MRSRGFRSALYSLAAKLSIVALNAGTGVLTARALHPAGRGELAAVLLWPLVLSGALTLGLPSALTFHIRRTPERVRALLLTAFTLALLVGAVGSVVAIALAPLLLVQYSTGIVFVARCLMPNLIVGLLLLTGRAALEADHRFGRSGVILAIPPLLTLLLLTALTLFHRLTPATAGISYTLSGLPAFALLLRSLPGSWREWRWKESWLQWRDAARVLLSYGVRSYGIDLAGTVSFYLDQAVVVGLLSPAAMGSYVVALSFSRVMSVPHQALASVLFPTMVNLTHDGTAEVTSRGMRLGGTLTVVATGVTLLVGQPLLTLVYGRAFAGDRLVLPMLTLEAGLSGCVLIAAQAFMAIDRPGTITVQQVLGLAASLPLLLLLVPRMGIRGAALSILLSTATRLVFIGISYGRTFDRTPTLWMDRESLHWLSLRFTAMRSAAVPAAIASGGGGE